jgi:hypothetical protein
MNVKSLSSISSRVKSGKQLSQFVERVSNMVETQRIQITPIFFFQRPRVGVHCSTPAWSWMWQWHSLPVKWEVSLPGRCILSWCAIPHALCWSGSYRLCWDGDTRKQWCTSHLGTLVAKNRTLPCRAVLRISHQWEIEVYCFQPLRFGDYLLWQHCVTHPD